MMPDKEKMQPVDVEKRIIATYDYKDESGKLLYQAVRYEPKDFRQRRPDGKGGWIWNLEGVRRVLYRLEELLRAGVVDRYKEHRKRPLAKHLEDFGKSLLAKGGTAKHAKQVESRVKRVFDECKFTFWNDIQASRVQHTISGLRKYVRTKEGLKDLGEISAQTYNFYLKAVKQFCKWMVQDGRASKSPVEHLQTISVRTDRRHDRRSLEPDEIRRLLEATQAAPERFGMTGYGKEPYCIVWP